MTERLTCHCCEKTLNPDTAVWLVYDNTNDTYVKDHDDIPEGHEDLGGYPFGKTCARKALAGEMA